MTRTLSVMLACGFASSALANPEPALWHKPMVQADLQTHTYFNPATGEKVVTILSDGVRPAESDASNPKVWISDNRQPCPGNPEVGDSVGIIDSLGAGTSLETGIIAHSWGDIENDTVIDCLGVTWSSEHADTDLNGDTVGDGVPGFASTWAFYDADNGFNDCFTRTGLIAITLVNLQGPVTPAPPGQIATFTATIDLGGTDSLVFEIGDSDSDLNGAAVHNARIFNTDIDGDTVVDSDKDGDGLYDFAYTQTFIQPGTRDIDGDTVVDGDPAAAADAGIRFGMPTGTATPNGGPGDPWTFTPDSWPQAQGIEDAWDVYTDTDNDGLLEYINSFFAGGFNCDTDTNGDTIGDGRITPFVQFEIALYGYDSSNPGGCINGRHCPPDLFPPGAPDGILNFLDLAEYLALFGAMNECADLFPVGAPDGVFNFFDLAQYLVFFNTGCP